MRIFTTGTIKHFNFLYPSLYRLFELLAQLDFIEIKVKKEEVREITEEEDYDFFQSAGLFANRNIDANQLRK